MKPTTYRHPHPALNHIIHYGALAVTGLLVASAPLQALLTLLGAPGGLFICSALISLLLAAPVLMLTAVAPAVTAADDGLTLHPVVWRERFVPWEQITAVKPFPLLPTEDAEVSRRYFVGQRRYRPAQGIMLVIPGLPLQYRIAGFFAGERAAPVIALTNRAHVDYEQLVRTVLAHTSAGIQHGVQPIRP